MDNPPFNQTSLSCSERLALFMFNVQVSTRIPAVESKVVSEEQTFRSEANAFLPLSSGQLLLLFITTLN
jgi:hypothetical protein